MLARMLGSAALAGSLVAATAVLLTLFLNPDVRPLREVWPLAVALFMPAWLVSFALLVGAILVVRPLPWWRQPRQSPVPELPGMTTTSLVAGAIASVLYWQNLFQYRHSIPVESVSALAAAGVAVSVATLVLLGVCVDVALFPQMGRSLAAPIALLAAASIVVVPLALLPRLAVPAPPAPVTTAPVEPSCRVTLVGVDGLGIAFLREEIARGRLPALAGLIRRGAFGPLATLSPTETPAVWATIVTGRLPRDHGVKSYERYRLLGTRTRYELLPRGVFVGLLQRVGLISAEPVTHVARRRRALWNALNAFGIDVGVVGLPGTHPVEHVRGFMLSNYFQRVPPARFGEALQPVSLAREVSAQIVRPEDIDPAWLGEFVDVSRSGDGQIDWRRHLVSEALAPDLSTLRAGRTLRTALDPPFFAVYFRGFDVVGRQFMRYAQPERFGDVSPDEIRGYGRVLQRYAALLAETVNDLALARRPHEVLLVVSGFGMEPVPLGQRLRARLAGAGTASGTHAGAPDGFVLAVGDGIRAGARCENASVLDIAPTVLYLMGLPVAHDMEGRVVSEILEDDFARAHPMTFIPSYESLAVTPIAPSEAVDLPPLPEEGP
jgi:predicted AlkP superfamily phosphohydrolase/phosphomutase